MKFLIVLFAVVAVATCKPHNPQGGQEQIFQVRVESAPQQHVAPPQAAPEPQIIRVITETVQAPAPAPPPAPAPASPPQVFRVITQQAPAPAPAPAHHGGGEQVFRVQLQGGGSSAHASSW